MKLTSCTFLSLLAGISLFGNPASDSRAATSRQRVRPNCFVENLGQAPEDVLWQAKGAGFEASFSRNSFVLRLFGAKPGATSLANPAAADGGITGLPKSSDPGRVFVTEQRISLAGASPEARIEPLDPLPGKMSFFRGSNSKRWVRGLATYARLRYKNVYPGIDLLFYSNQGTLEYDFVVAPGADPGSIRLRVEDGRPVHITEHGVLQVGEGAEAVSHRPLLYQNMGSGKKAVEGKFVSFAANTVGFRFSGYDASRTLVIDPALVLSYSTYLGGPHDDESTGIAVDAEGNAYMLGWSASTTYPVSANAYQPNRKLPGVVVDNMVLTKISPSGTLLYSTFLGGSTGETSGGIVLDAAGNAYVTGTTKSTDYPVTSGAYQGTYPSGAPTSFVVSEISPDGSALVYSTFFGGSGGATASSSNGSAFYQGNLYVVGSAGSGLPTTPGAYLTQINSGQAAFVAAFNLAAVGAAQLVASTYYGAANPAANFVTTGNGGYSMALDSSGNPWIAGQTYTNNLPTTANALQPALPALSTTCQTSGANLNSAAYVAKLSSNLTSLLYGSYLSGQKTGASVSACSEYAHALAVDPTGNVYISGATASASFPTTSGVVQASYPNSNNYVGF
ncbi:MAG TPA: SBBP repeat-containing protein, partial [Bryobacteraceae bacterium]|nr:SBBP repeat-containing protein [Bryobacteraceae bacterium]